MNLYPDALVIESTIEYIKFRLLNDLKAYKNVTLPLFPDTSNRFPHKQIYTAPRNQWVYDSSLTGVQVPSGVAGLNRGQSGLSIDYINGRVMLNSGVNLASPSINVSVTDFNSYITTKSTNDLIFEELSRENPVVRQNAPIKEDSVVLPCFFVKFKSTNNQPYCLGGVQKSIWEVQLSVFARDYFELYGFQSVIRDIKGCPMPYLATSPLNEYNDLKFDWKYLNYIENMDTSKGIYIDDSSFQIIDSDYINTNHPKVLVGLGTLKLAVYRGKKTGYYL